VKGLPSGIQLFDNAQTPIETPPSIQHNEHTEQTEHEKAKDEHHDGAVARQAGVDVGESTILADLRWAPMVFITMISLPVQRRQ